MRPQIERRTAQPYVAIAAHVTTEAEFRRIGPMEEPDFSKRETELAYLTSEG